MTAIGEVARKDGGIRPVLNMPSSHRLVSRMPRFLLSASGPARARTASVKTQDMQRTNNTQVKIL